MKKRLLYLLLACLLLIVACDANNTKGEQPDSADSSATAVDSPTQAKTETETESDPVPMKTFQNPVSDVSAPDPCVVYHDGYYYAVYTEVFGINLYRSKSLETVVRDEKRTILEGGSGETTCTSIWAPELHYNPATDRWYIYFSDATKPFDFFSIRMMCLESTTSDPWSDYVYKGCTDPDLLAIDQTVFYDQVSDTLYTAFSEFSSDKGQVITLAVMENPWTISDRRMRVSYPLYGWERRGKTEGKDERVNEGPVFLCHNGKLTLIYSASGCWSEYYCLGLIEYTGEDFSPENMMDPAGWDKKKKAVFSAANEVYGVGHCTFFSSPDGTETWIAYHGMATPDAGESNRFMYVQPISFDESDLPVIGKPLSRDTAIGAPSGEQ